MVDIAGFRGISYDPTRVDLARVITPPYDVIDAAQRAALADRSPYNFVRIDLPLPEANADRYQVAAAALADFQVSGMLCRDPVPALYRYHQEFTDPEHERTLVRKGIIAAVMLSPWSAGVIRPHEATFAAPREDRIRLLEATRVHLSPVFAMYDDRSLDVEHMLERHAAPPDLAVTTDDGTRHSMWRVSNAATIAEVARLLAPSCAYVLDGHHRYETMVAFQDHAARRGAAHAALQRGLMFLVPMSDPGLVILPTHRLVQRLPGLTRDRFLTEVRRHARVEPVHGGARDAARLQRLLAAASDGPCFAAVLAGDPDAYLLSVDADGRSPLEPETAVLHRIILERVLGAIAGPGSGDVPLRYLSNTRAAVDEVAGARAQLALLVRPSQLSQIKELADRGHVMPQKSTYFHPKLASGLVMMPLE